MVIFERTETIKTGVFTATVGRILFRAEVYSVTAIRLGGEPKAKLILIPCLPLLLERILIEQWLERVL